MNTMTALDKFTLAYIECALWSSMDDSGEPLDRNYSIKDLAPETLEKMIQDCNDFRKSNLELLSQSELSAEQAGHDFWLTRNGHGAGFWDRGLDEIGKELTAMCKPYGEFNLYVGNDGKIYA